MPADHGCSDVPSDRHDAAVHERSGSAFCTVKSRPLASALKTRSK
jgi:hypothetical protein